HRGAPAAPRRYKRPAAAFKSATTWSFFARAFDDSNVIISMIPFVRTVAFKRMGASDSEMANSPTPGITAVLGLFGPAVARSPCRSDAKSTPGNALDVGVAMTLRNDFPDCTLPPVPHSYAHARAPRVVSVVAFPAPIWTLPE